MLFEDIFESLLEQLSPKQSRDAGVIPEVGVMKPSRPDASEALPLTAALSTK